MFEQPPIELGERNLEFARVEIEPSLDYAQIRENLIFGKGREPGRNEKPQQVRFRHAMDAGSLMISFRVNIWDKGFNHIRVVNSRVRELQDAKNAFNALYHGCKTLDDGDGDFGIELGIIEPDHLVALEIVYLTKLTKCIEEWNPKSMDHRQGQRLRSYELFLPASINPAFISNPAVEGMYKRMFNTPGKIEFGMVNVVAPQTSFFQIGDFQNPKNCCDEVQRFQFDLAGDVHLRFSYKDSQSLKSTHFHDVEARVFRFQLPPVTVIDEEENQHDYRNPLNDKFGIIVDYAIEQNMTEETSSLINQYVKIDVTDSDNKLLEINGHRGPGFDATNMFNGIPSGPVNQTMSDQTSHFRYAAILDTIPDNGVKVKLTANYVDTPTFQWSKNIKAETMQNPLFGSYIKSGLDALHENMESTKLVNLSCFTGILSPLTAFVGIRKEKGDLMVTKNGIVHVKYGRVAQASTDMLEIHGDVDNTHFDAFGGAGRRAPRPSGNMSNTDTVLIESVEKHIIEDLKRLGEPNGIMKPGVEVDRILTKFSGYLIPLTNSEARTKLIMLFANILPKAQMDRLTADGQLMQTFIFVVFLFIFGKKSRSAWDKYAKKCIKCLSSRMVHLNRATLDQITNGARQTFRTPVQHFS